MIPIAVVEDNPGLLEDLLYSLRQQGFRVTGFADGRSFDAALAAGAQWRVVVLDLGLPGEDGLSIARRLRGVRPATGIVMVTARSSLDDRITGMDAGADLYLAKPVNLRELGAAVSAVARRVEQIGSTPTEAPAATRVAWQIDGGSLKVIRPGGEAVRLTLAEVRVLEALAGSPAQLADRTALVIALGKNPDVYEERALEVMLSRLRRKLGDDAPLRAVRGKGYAFAAPLRILAR